ncbi:predicted protein [Arabidopsis lyrata subsp. lyrata]|uniref:Predicted protein n=1 Tax=Arabidopsis lyrata subsp. lyrata TaxID=81972 RepID=D7MRE3_ARALL|nr:predicted protein [Arabidopsis lyrata subsp. lyrata]
MRNIRFLEIKKCPSKEVNLHLPESFDYLPPKLKLLCWPDYPMRSMPTTFSPKNLIKIKMQFSKLEKLWEGVASLTCLKEMDLYGCAYLKEIPDLAMAANLETLILVFCVSLVKLSSSVQNLNKLTTLDMKFCMSLETLPTFINLKSLNYLDLKGCLQLRNLPEISIKISKLILNDTAIEQIPCNLRLENLVELQMRNLMGEKLRKGVQPFMPLQAMLSPTLTKLQLENMPSLVELPSSFQNLNQLKYLHIQYCINLETLPTGINLQSLVNLNFKGCSRLRSFPEISTNISSLDLDETGIEEVPWWIENFSNLGLLSMDRCSRLKCVSLHISKLKHLKKAYSSDCGALTRVDLSGYESGVEMMEADNMSKEASSSLPDSCVPDLNFWNCFNLDPETILRQQSIIFNYMIFPGKEVPSYFTHRTTGISSLTIPLLHVPLSQPIFRFRVGAVVTNNDEVHIKVKCEFKGICGNSFDVCSDFYVYTNYKEVREGGHMLTILDCRIPLNEDNTPLAQRDYDHVDMQIDASDDCIKGWGIRLLEDCSSPENQLGNLINIKGLVKSGDINVETERSRKRMRGNTKICCDVLMPICKITRYHFESSIANLEPELDLFLTSSSIWTQCYVELPFIFGHVFQADESNRDNEPEYVEKSGDREKRKQIKITRH